MWITILLAFTGVCLTTFLEVDIFPIPFTLFFLILLSVFLKKSWIYFLAIFAGLLMDTVRFTPFGERGLFYLCVVGVIFLYGRKFEIQNYFFIGIMTCIAAFAYFLFFGFQNLLLQMILTMVLPVVSFLTFLVKGKMQP